MKNLVKVAIYADDQGDEYYNVPWYHKGDIIGETLVGVAYLTKMAYFSEERIYVNGPRPRCGRMDLCYETRDYDTFSKLCSKEFLNLNEEDYNFVMKEAKEREGEK